jgi:hypothetical protein
MMQEEDWDSKRLGTGRNFPEILERQQCSSSAI